MSRITVIGGTGYAGSAIATEAAARGHEVTSLSRSLPLEPVVGVNYVLGNVEDETALSPAIANSEVVVGALAPRGALTDTFREVYGRIARLSEAAGAPLFVVGGFSSLRPSAGAPRFVEDLSQAPAELRNALVSVSALVTDDLPATPESLNWVFVSPAQGFGSRAPGERTGKYRLGYDVAVHPDEGGGTISGADFAIGFVDLIEQGTYFRAHLNLAY